MTYRAGVAAPRWGVGLAVAAAAWLLLAAPAQATTAALGPLPMVSGSTTVAKVDCDTLSVSARLDDSAYSGRVSVVKFGGSTIATRTFTSSVSFTVTVPSAGTYAAHISILYNGKAVSTSPQSRSITMGTCAGSGSGGATSTPSPSSATPSHTATPTPSQARRPIGPTRVPVPAGDGLAPSPPPSPRDSSPPETTTSPSASSSASVSVAPPRDSQTESPAEPAASPSSTPSEPPAEGIASSLPLPFGLASALASSTAPLGLVLGLAILVVGALAWALMRPRKPATAPLPVVASAGVIPVERSAAQPAQARVEGPAMGLPPVPVRRNTPQPTTMPAAEQEMARRNTSRMIAVPGVRRR